MAWARDRFPILMNTELVGGNPMKGETYGYTHFKGNRGIIAARNPVIEASKLKVQLDPSQGLDPKASGLVLERVYPTRWISPELCTAGDVVALPLEGFETAVFELYPLSEATEPLVAGVAVDVLSKSGGNYKLQLHSSSADVAILNPSVLASSGETMKKTKELVAELRKNPTPAVVTGYSIKSGVADRSMLEVTLSVGGTSRDGMLAILLTQDDSIAGKIPLKVTASLDGKEATVKTERQEGKSQWYEIEVGAGKHIITLKMKTTKEEVAWRGKATAWYVARQKQNSGELSLTLNQALTDRVLPPLAWPAGEIRRNVKIGQADVSAGKSQ